MSAGKSAVSQAGYYLLGDAYLKEGMNPEALSAFKAASDMDFDPRLQEEAFYHFAKASVVFVQMSGIVTAMANEKLRSSCISAGVSHRKYSSIVVLVFTVQFTFDFITWSAGSVSNRTTSLNYKIWNYTVKSKPVVKALIGQIHKILNSVWSIFFVKLHFHCSFCCDNFCCFHSFKIKVSCSTSLFI